MEKHRVDNYCIEIHNNHEVWFFEYLNREEDDCFNISEIERLYSNRKMNEYDLLSYNDSTYQVFSDMNRTDFSHDYLKRLFGNRYEPLVEIYLILVMTMTYGDNCSITYNEKKYHLHDFLTFQDKSQIVQYIKENDIYTAYKLLDEKPNHENFFRVKLNDDFVYIEYQ